VAPVMVISVVWAEADAAIPANIVPRMRFFTFMFGFLLVVGGWWLFSNFFVLFIR
jgi:hypothetical protein